MSTEVTGQQQKVIIKQLHEVAEIITGFETSNKYQVFDLQGGPLGYIYENSGGALQFLTRSFLRSHRPLNVSVFDCFHFRGVFS